MRTVELLCDSLWPALITNASNVMSFFRVKVYQEPLTSNSFILTFSVKGMSQKKHPELFSNLFVFSFSSFVALLKPLARDDSAWQTPSSLPHTFPHAIRNYHTVRVLACPKATAGLIFLAWLFSDMPGKGKERKWVDQRLSVPPEQAWEKPAQCFSTRPGL